MCSVSHLGFLINTTNKLCQNTVKLVLRGHLWNKEKVAL